MKSFITIIVLLCFLSISSYAQPKLEIVGGDTYSWNKVTPQDSPLKATIQIKNAGNELLKITEVRPTCGCTTAPLTKSNLEPGEVTTLNVTLRVNASNTTVRKSIIINSNDPETPTKSLTIEAEVVQPLKLIPNNYFNFSEMKVGTEATSTIKLQNNTPNEISILDYEVKPETVSMNIPKEKTLKPGEFVDLTAKVTPEKPGYFSFIVRIKTTAAEMPELSIQGSGNVSESPIFNN